jgi:hypothetical protein
MEAYEYLRMREWTYLVEVYVTYERHFNVDCDSKYGIYYHSLSVDVVESPVALNTVRRV